jgi:8-oxo-dGTP pyrophosphatase MutT (NUDIX family)
MKWKVLESQYLHQDPWLTIRKDKCELPNGNIVPEFYINEYPDWVNAFALTKEGDVIMVKQYRHGIGEVSIELPGGVAEKGESPGEAMRRELLEETGYKFDKIEYLAKVSANPSTTNNFTHLFLATGGQKVTDQKLDENEELQVEIHSVEAVKQMVKENKIMQSLHLNAIMYSLLKLEQLPF